MNVINKNAIESVRVFKREVDYHYEYREEKRNFLCKNNPAGFYNAIWGGSCANDRLKKDNRLILGKHVYYRPYVQITLFSGKKRIINKDSWKEAYDYAVKFIKDNDLDDVMISY